MFGIYKVRHVGHSGDDVHVKLAVKPLLHYLHVQQTEETATEAEAQRHTALRAEAEAGIIELQLLKRAAQVLKVLRGDWIDAGEHHGLHFLKAGDGIGARIGESGDGVAHLNLGGCLYAADDIAHIAAAYLLARLHLHL